MNGLIGIQMFYSSATRWKMYTNGPAGKCSFTFKCNNLNPCLVINHVPHAVVRVGYFAMFSLKISQNSSGKLRKTLSVELSRRQMQVFLLINLVSGYLADTIMGHLDACIVFS